MKPKDSKEVRNHNFHVKKHAKEHRKVLKNKRIPVTAQAIAIS